MLQQRFDELIIELANEVQEYLAKSSTGHRRRLRGAQWNSFLASVEVLVSKSLSLRFMQQRRQDAIIHLNKSRYPIKVGDARLTYRMHVERAYRGLKGLGYFHTTKNGSSHGIIGLYATRYTATQKLVDKLSWLPLVVAPALLPRSLEGDLVRIQLIKKVKTTDGRTIRKKESITLESCEEIVRQSENLQCINRVLSRSWVDLELSDDQLNAMYDEMHNSSEIGRSESKKLLDLTRTSLYRVYNNREMTLGGRFYGAWWQQIPSSHRQFIVIDGKRTNEIDYSGLHPSLLYLELGLRPPADPYGCIVDRLIEAQSSRELARRVIKKAFNAMLNAPKRLNFPPRSIAADLQKLHISWKNLVECIMAVHRPVAHHLFAGVGLKLQKIDSDIAEEILLHFALSGERVPVLPVHDSFIAHWGYEDELKDAMERSIKSRFGPSASVPLRMKQRAAASTSGEEAADARGAMSTVYSLLERMSEGHALRLRAFEAVRDANVRAHSLNMNLSAAHDRCRTAPSFSH